MSAGKDQRDAFLAGEGDGYYRRNQAAHVQTHQLRAFLAERIARHLDGRGRMQALEVGCADGGNLAALRALRDVEAFGVDPSSEAVQAGMSKFPDLKLGVGTADSLAFADASFDLVWLGFFLYVVDRALLHRTVAECDRVLRDGALLVIHDFDPDVPCRRPYRHRAGLHSYKMDYSRLFLADPAYSLLEKASFSHDELKWSADPQERLGLWICRKNVGLGYVER